MKKGKNKFKWFYIDLFKVNVYYQFGPAKQYEKDMLQVFNVQIEDSGPASVGKYAIVEENEDIYFTMWVRDKRDYESIAHEAMHITHGILQRAGIWLTDSSVETYTYLIGYIVKKITENKN